MGGGFGGKETQGNLVRRRWPRWPREAPAGRPRSGYDRDDDMVMTGKRHDFRIDYDVGFDDEGRILGVDWSFAAALRLLLADLSPAGQRPRAVPCRQRLLPAAGACADPLAPLQDQHRLQHGLPRLRRAAGHGRGRAGDGLQVALPPARTRWSPQAELLRRMGVGAGAT
jgi:hypothetical protein